MSDAVLILTFQSFCALTLVLVVGVAWHYSKKQKN